MDIREVDRADGRALKEFVRLERELIGSHPYYWSDADSDVRKRLTGRSAFSQDMELQPFVAGDGRPVARCAAIVNRRWQAEREPDTGFVGYFAAGPGSEEAVVGMLQTAEEWLAHRGVRRVIAPFNGSGLIGFALRTDGHDESPMFPGVWTPPYYVDYLRAAGYAPAYPLYEYAIDFASEAYRTASQRALAEPRCTVRRVDRKRWNEEIDTLRILFNEGFREEWEFHSYTQAEFLEMYGPLKGVIDPRMLLFAEVAGKPVGFTFGFPDWTELFRSFKGKFGPLQLLRFLRGAKRFDRAGLIGIAILPDQRGKRIGQTLAAHLYRGLEEMGLDGGLYYWVNEANTASRGLAKSFGATEHLNYHCYEKRLD